MPQIVDGDSSSAFPGENRPSSQMTHCVLLLSDRQSSITGPNYRATPALNHHVTRGVVPPAHGLRHGLSRFSLHGWLLRRRCRDLGPKPKLIVVCGSPEPATKGKPGAHLNVTTVG